MRSAATRLLSVPGEAYEDTGSIVESPGRTLADFGGIMMWKVITGLFAATPLKMEVVTMEQNLKKIIVVFAAMIFYLIVFARDIEKPTLVARSVAVASPAGKILSDAAIVKPSGICRGKRLITW